MRHQRRRNPRHDSVRTYREHRPASVLAPFVDCYWTSRIRVAPDEERVRPVLPDACMDLLFDLSPDRPVGSGSLASQVVGTMTRPLPVRERGDLDFLGVRFRPGCARPFLGIPATEVTDSTIPLDVLWGRDAARLRDRLGEASCVAARIRILDETLGSLVDGAREALDGPVVGAVELARRDAGNTSVEALAHTAGLGRRQLERRFLAAVGIPPKVVCRVLRFQETIESLRGRPDRSLAEVALRAGYHDQAHFARDFRTFAGESPGRYRRRHEAHSNDDAFVQDRARAAE